METVGVGRSFFASDSDPRSLAMIAEAKRRMAEISPLNWKPLGGEEVAEVALYTCIAIRNARRIGLLFLSGTEVDRFLEVANEPMPDGL